MSDIKISPPNFAQYQKDILYNDARYTITEASTKVGKTFIHIFWLFEVAHGYENGIKIKTPEKGYNYWWVAPVYSQAKIAFDRMWNKISHTGLYTSNRADLTITTPIGSVIHFKTASNPDNLYGEDVYACVFDEFTRSKQEAWFALRSTLTSTRAKCKFIGNYKGKSNWGHQLALKADTDNNYRYFRITAWDAVKAGILEEEEVLQAQKDLPSFIFKALYLAEGEIDNARLIDDNSIDCLLTNEHVKKTGTHYLTADIAFQGSDKFVIMIWDGLVIIDIIVIDKSSGKDIEDKIKGLADKYKIMRKNIIYDGDGVGNFLAGYLKGAKSFKNGGKPIKEKGRKVDFANLKTQCYYKLSDLVNNGEIFISCNSDKYWSDIIEELECLKNRSYKTDAKIEVLRKKEIYEIIGRSPDFTDAMMMRMYFEIRPQGLSYA